MFFQVPVRSNGSGCPVIRITWLSSIRWLMVQLAGRSLCGDHWTAEDTAAGYGKKTLQNHLQQVDKVRSKHMNSPENT